MSQRFPIHIFRDGRFSRAGDTVVTLAPLDLVVSVFGGGGGLKGEQGLEDAFGGVVFFRNDETGMSYLGVWGRRKASRCRGALRRSGAQLDLQWEPPPARLIFWSRGRPSRLRLPLVNSGS
jgi:hypothetical protein